MKIFEWIKTNKLLSVLILVIVFLLIKDNRYSLKNMNTYQYGIGESMMYMDSASPARISNTMLPPTGGASPELEVEERMVVTNSTMSLLVKDVQGAISTIKQEADNAGGYMVSQHITTPEGLTNGSITVRVPTEELEGVMQSLRDLSVKVVSENQDGTDVTDQYVDIEERLSILEATKAKYESILNSATEVEDILNVTERMIYVQNQIDNLKGRMDYLEKTSSSSLITVYLSTDELELPYAPDQPWRPGVVFKYAVRGMVQTLRDVASILIWVGVYAIIWAPLVAIFIFVKKRIKANKPKN